MNNQKKNLNIHHKIYIAYTSQDIEYISQDFRIKQRFTHHNHQIKLMFYNMIYIIYDNIQFVILPFGMQLYCNIQGVKRVVPGLTMVTTSPATRVRAISAVRAGLRGQCHANPLIPTRQFSGTISRNAVTMCRTPVIQNIYFFRNIKILIY